MDANTADARRLRINDGVSIDNASQEPPRTLAGAPTFAGTTTTVTTYPTSAGKFFAIKFTAITGTESEGSSATLATRTSIIYAYNLGTAIPATGTTVVCTWVPYRWVFRYDG